MQLHVEQALADTPCLRRYRHHVIITPKGMSNWAGAGCTWSGMGSIGMAMTTWSYAWINGDNWNFPQVGGCGAGGRVRWAGDGGAGACPGPRVESGAGRGRPGPGGGVQGAHKLGGATCTTSHTHVSKRGKAQQGLG